MNRTGRFWNWAVLLKPLMIIFVLVAAILVGMLMTRGGMRELAIVIIGVLMTILFLSPTPIMLRVGFLFLIITFGFGWRTLYLMGDLNIHPIEVTMFLIFIGFLMRSLFRLIELNWAIPGPMALLIPFIFMGMITGFLNNTRLDLNLNEFKIFLAYIPMYYVVQWSIQTRNEWERATLFSAVVGLYISVLGIIDNYAPGITGAMTGRQIDAFTTVDAFSGFTRVGFMFFGNYTAGFVIFTFFGWSFYRLVKQGPTSRGERLLGLGLVTAQLMGIYLTGFRGLWYALTVFFVCYALLRRKGLIPLGIGIAAIPFLPDQFFNRFVSLVDSTYADSSQFVRIGRATAAADQMFKSPILGIGWGGSGYVHSDLIQYGANMGMIGLGVFLTWVLSLILKMFELARRQDWIGEQAAILFATICGLVIVLAGEGLLEYAQLMLPVWFLFAMAHKLAHLAEQQDVSVESHG